MTPLGTRVLPTLAASLAMCAASFAMPLAQGRAAHAELGGTWISARFSGNTTTPPDATLLRMSPVSVTRMREPLPPVFEFAPGDFGGLRLQPAAKERALQWRPVAEPSLATACSPASILQAMTSPFAIEIHPATELIVLRLEYFDLVRIVFTDGRPHPGSHYPHSKTGHSIGHWERDVLVIDTTHLEPSIITMNGVDHTEDLHVIERIRLDGTILHYTQQFEDTAALEQPAVRYVQFRREPRNVMPYECDPSYAAAVRARQK